MGVEIVAPGIKGRVAKLSNAPQIAGKMTISTKKKIAACELPEELQVSLCKQHACKRNVP
jgi:hypothetical protein